MVSYAYRPVNICETALLLEKAAKENISSTPKRALVAKVLAMDKQTGEIKEIKVLL